MPRTARTPNPQTHTISTITQAGIPPAACGGTADAEFVDIDVAVIFKNFDDVPNGKSGTLKQGNHFICGEHYGKVRAMVNNRGKRTISAAPSISEPGGGT